MMTTSKNERTHFFIKINLSHFILERGCFLCVRGESETGTDCYIATLLSHSGWATQPWVIEGPRSLSGAGFHSPGILSPTDSSRLCPGFIFVCRPPASAYLYRCIDGSVEGQYIAESPWCNG